VEKEESKCLVHPLVSSTDTHIQYDLTEKEFFMAQSQTIDRSLTAACNLQLDTKRSKPLPTAKQMPSAAAAGAYTLFGWFAYLTPDAQPGLNVATVNLGSNFWIASAFPNEVGTDGTPHVGAANFDILSVEIDTNQQICQVRFNLDWSYPLPAGLMMVLGYQP
jgi:hypothetical protein